jgi:hypothetical protein
MPHRIAMALVAGSPVLSTAIRELVFYGKLKGDHDGERIRIMSVKDEVVYTTPLDPDLVIRPIPEEVRRRALEGIPRLRALREAIRADREGQSFSEDEITGALHEARAAHERGE